jgi:hypothetical protein
LSCSASSRSNQIDELPGQQLGLRDLRELEEELGVLAPQLVRLPGVLESLERELADRLQHPEALVRVP